MQEETLESLDHQFGWIEAACAGGCCLLQPAMGLVMAAPPLLLLLQAAAAVGGSPAGRRPHICFILADVRKSNRCCRALAAVGTVGAACS